MKKVNKRNKILVVYNICGIRGNNVGLYKSHIQSILEQNFLFYKKPKFHLAISSYASSVECLDELVRFFDEKDFLSEVSIWKYDKTDGIPLSVNITFNATVKNCVDKFGEFEYYLYLDSGCSLPDKNLLKDMYDSAKVNDYAMLSLRTNTDFINSYQVGAFKNWNKSNDFNLKDWIIPLGIAINGHANMFSNDYRKTFVSLWPDVFRTWCSESVFSFICAAMHKKWAVAKKYIINHKCGIDGPSSGISGGGKSSHWNNLYFDRDANDFVKNKDAISAGLGYEECHKVMMHDSSAYDSEGNAKYPKKLIDIINKYLFLSKDELDYNKLGSEHITKK